MKKLLTVLLTVLIAFTTLTINVAAAEVEAVPEEEKQNEISEIVVEENNQFEGNLAEKEDAPEVIEKEPTEEVIEEEIEPNVEESEVNESLVNEANDDEVSNDYVEANLNSSNDVITTCTFKRVNDFDDEGTYIILTTRVSGGQYPGAPQYYYGMSTDLKGTQYTVNDEIENNTDIVDKGNGYVELSSNGLALFDYYRKDQKNYLKCGEKYLLRNDNSSISLSSSPSSPAYFNSNNIRLGANNKNNSLKYRAGYDSWYTTNSSSGYTFGNLYKLVEYKTATINLDGGAIKAPSTIPAGWTSLDDGATYTKDFEKGAKVDTILSEWANVNIEKDGFKPDGWTPNRSKDETIIEDKVWTAKWTPVEEYHLANSLVDGGKYVISSKNLPSTPGSFSGIMIRNGNSYAGNKNIDIEGDISDPIIKLVASQNENAIFVAEKDGNNLYLTVTVDGDKYYLGYNTNSGGYLYFTNKNNAKNIKYEDGKVKINTSSSTYQPIGGKSGGWNAKEEPGRNGFLFTADNRQLVTAILNDGEEYTYTGKQIQPEVTVTAGTTTLTKDVDYILKYGENINVKPTGDNKNFVEVTLTSTAQEDYYFDGDSETEKTLDFEITPIIVTPKLVSKYTVDEKTTDYMEQDDETNDYYLTYDGNEYTIDAEFTTTGDTPTTVPLNPTSDYTVSVKKYVVVDTVEPEESSDPALETGKYTATVTLINTNYSFDKKHKLFKAVAKASSEPLTKDENPSEPISFEVRQALATLSFASGEYPATGSPIEPEDVVLTFTDRDGKDKTIDNETGIDDLIEIEYVDEDGREVTPQSVGNYYAIITLKAEDDGNFYTDNTDDKLYSEKVPFTIVDPTIVVSAKLKANPDLTYTGEEVEPEVEVYYIDKNGAKHVVENTTEKPIYTVDYENNVNVNNRYPTYATITLTEDSGFTFKDRIGRDTNKAYVEFDIVPKAVTLPTAITGLVYDGTQQTGVNYELGKGYTPSWGSVVEATDADDSYNAYFALDNSGNYKWPEGTELEKRGWYAGQYKVTWAISKKAVKYDDVLDMVNELVYNGNSQQPIELPRYLSYSDIAAWAYNGANSATNAGNYNAYIEIRNSNYAWDTSKGTFIDGYFGTYAVIPWNIAKRNVYLSSGEYSKVYGESDPKFEVIDISDKENNEGFINRETYLINNFVADRLKSDDENAGGHDIYVIKVGDRGLDNYSVDYSGKGTLTINKAKLTVRLDIPEEGLTYNAKEQEPKVLFTGFTGYEGPDYVPTRTDYTVRYNYGLFDNSVDAGTDKYASVALTTNLSKNYYLEGADYFGYVTLYYEIAPKTVHVHWENSEHKEDDLCYVYNGRTHSPDLVFEDLCEGDEDYVDYFQVDLRLGDIPEDKDELKTLLETKVNEIERANGANLYRFRDAGEYCSFALITGTRASNYYFVGQNEDDIWNDDVDPWFHRIAYTDFTIDQRELRVVWENKTKFVEKSKAQAPKIKGLEVVNDPYNDAAIVDYDEDIVYVDYDEEFGPKTKASSKKYTAIARLYTSDDELVAFLHPTSNYKLVNDSIDFKIYRKSNEDTTPVKTGVDR